MGLTALAEDRADVALRALAEPRRRAILRLVSDQERSAGEIAAEFDVSRPAISQHLGVLKEADLVTERRDGARRLYLARREGLQALRELLNDLWGSGLARAAALAEAEPDPDAPTEATAMSESLRTNVVPMQRPPIRQSIVVHQERDRTFWTFVRRLGDWWPLTPFSWGAERVARVEFDEKLAGRVYEVWTDGTEHDWGQVIAWQPPELFVMTWNITGEPTDVELRFTAIDDGTTRVDLEHRGWERLTEAQLGEDCALPGGYLGGSFERGWRTILGLFSTAAEKGRPMTLAVGFYEELGPGGMAQAREVFPRHTVYADEFAKSGELLMIGTFADPVADGSMAIFRSRDAAERFVANDPFVVEGVVARWRILDWNAEAPETLPA